MVQIFLSRALSNAMPRQPHPNKSIKAGRKRTYVQYCMSNTVRMYDLNDMYLRQSTVASLSYYKVVVATSYKLGVTK